MSYCGAENRRKLTTPPPLSACEREIFIDYPVRLFYHISLFWVMTAFLFIYYKIRLTEEVAARVFEKDDLPLTSSDHFNVLVSLYERIIYTDPFFYSAF